MGWAGDHSRARRAAARFGSPALSVEERQMDSRHRAARQRCARILGAERLSYARRSLEKRALWVVGGRRGARAVQFSLFCRDSISMYARRIPKQEAR